jgi:ABC-2 type transport system ATP-binding protein
VTIDVELAADDMTALEEVIKQMPGVTDVRVIDTGLMIHATDTVTTTAINKYCFEKGIVLSQLTLKKKSLETRFLEITGTQSDR